MSLLPAHGQHGKHLLTVFERVQKYGVVYPIKFGLFEVYFFGNRTDANDLYLKESKLFANPL